jgi:5-formyltetrahydrofolate cyclo-ligase
MGKGHGYFDLEWAMLRDIGVVTEATPVIALVHDCQVVDSDLQPSPHDTVADLIVTPTRVIEVPKVHPKPGGINWAVLPAHYLDEIPPLRELRDMQAAP